MFFYNSQTRKLQVQSVFFGNQGGAPVISINLVTLDAAGGNPFYSTVSGRGNDKKDLFYSVPISFHFLCNILVNLYGVFLLRIRESSLSKIASK